MSSPFTLRPAAVLEPLNKLQVEKDLSPRRHQAQRTAQLPASHSPFISMRIQNQVFPQPVPHTPLPPLPAALDLVQKVQKLGKDSELPNHTPHPKTIFASKRCPPSTSMLHAPKSSWLTSWLTCLEPPPGGHKVPRGSGHHRSQQPPLPLLQTFYTLSAIISGFLP